MTMPQIESVIFDLGRTLIHFDLKFFLIFLGQHGINFQTTSELAHQVAMYDYERGLISSEQFLENISKLATKPLDQPRLITEWQNIFTPIPEMLELLAVIKKKLPVYIITNINELHWQHLQETYNLNERAHGIIRSFEVNEIKPHPKIFNTAIERFGVNPKTSVFIDDHEPNVTGARNLGWHGIHYTSPEKTKEELKALGVEVE